MRKQRAIVSFFKTPKGLLLVVLTVFMAIAAPGQGLGAVVRGLAAAVGVAGLLDAAILRQKRRRWEFPSGAVLTAMIVLMVLSAQAPWYVPAIVSAAAVASKYVFRSRAANVFNPAALAIVASFHLFGTPQSWWGALPEVLPIAQATLVAAGVFISDRVNRIPLVLAFLGTYFLLFTLTALTGDPRRVSEIFRTPDLQAVLYFAFFILTDPPTSPVTHRDQIIYGVIVAAASYGVFEWIGAVYFLLAGVLVGNVWEAWRRVNRRKRHAFPRAVGSFLREVTPWRTREV